MTDFVRGNFTQKVLNEFLGFGSLRIHSAAYQEIERELSISHCAFGEITLIPGIRNAPRRHECSRWTVFRGHGERIDLLVHFAAEKASHGFGKANVGIVNLAGLWVSA